QRRSRRRLYRVPNGRVVRLRRWADVQGRTAQRESFGPDYVRCPSCAVRSATHREHCRSEIPGGATRALRENQTGSECTFEHKTLGSIAYAEKCTLPPSWGRFCIRA